MENTANWRTESRTVYSNDFKLRIVELASQPDANVAKIALKMELLTTSFLSGCACGKTRGGYHVACLRPSPHLQSCHCYLSRSYLNHQHQITVPGSVR